MTTVAAVPKMHIEQGKLYYRSKLMRNLVQAQNFMKMLAGNDRFTNPAIVRSTQSKGLAYFVTYVPSNPDRQSDMQSAMQSKRVKSALAEQLHYQWRKDTREEEYWFCVGKSGNEHRTDGTTCTCEDFQYRCRQVNIFCIHCLMCAMRITPDELEEASEGQETRE